MRKRSKNEDKEEEKRSKNGNDCKKAREVNKEREVNKKTVYIKVDFYFLFQISLKS